MSERYYVYAITDRDIRLPERITGFGGALFTLRDGDLGAVVSRLDATTGGEGIPPSMDNLVLHERVVEAIHEAGRALPVRFGSTLPGASAVASALRRYASALRNDLERIGAKDEMGVTVLWSPTQTAGPPARDHEEGQTRAKVADSAPQSGLAFLRARQRVYQRADVARARAQTLADELDATLGSHAVTRLHAICPSERLAMRSQYLLDREQAPAFRAAFDEVRERYGARLRFLLSGPWPPYSFVTPLT